MLNLVNIDIKNTSIENIDVIKKQITDSLNYLEELKLSSSDDYDVICNNLKISTDIEDGCKLAISTILNKTGDINELISALEKMQKEARFLRLDLEKAKKDFKANQINNFNSNYFELLTSKAKEFASQLPRCNIEEEVRRFYNEFIAINFKGVKEADLDVKNELNNKEVLNYLSNIEFKIKAFNQSQFINNFIPITLKFIDSNLVIEFNNNQYTALDYDKVKAEYDILIKTQLEQEEAIRIEKEFQEQKLKEKELQPNIQEEVKTQEVLKEHTPKEYVEEIKEKNTALLKIKQLVKLKADYITDSDIVRIGDKLSITIHLTRGDFYESN